MNLCQAARPFLRTLAANSCRQHFSSTRPVFAPKQQRSSDIRFQNVRRARTANVARESRDATTFVVSEERPVDSLVNVTPDKIHNGDADLPQVLDELLYPGTTSYLTRYIPLQAAADIVMKVRSVEGHATPPELVTEVLKIAEHADPSHRPWPLKAISVLAMSLARPGETPGSKKNGDLIAKLLLIAMGAPNGPYGQNLLLYGSLFGVLKNRANGDAEILLTEYSSEAREEYDRLLSTHSLPPGVYRSRAAYSLRRESDPDKRDMLVQKHLDDFNAMFSGGDDSARSIVSLEIGRTYALGDALPRDGQKAKLWWERTIILGSRLPSRKAAPVSRAAFHLACIYLGMQSRVYGRAPLFPPDIPKGIRYLHLAKWSFGHAAYLLGKIYYLDSQDANRKRAKKRHVKKFGVGPDDAVAAEAFYIGAERLGDKSCKLKFAEMMEGGRAHPPVDPSIVKGEVVPQESVSPPRTTELADAPSEDDLERMLSSYNNVPRIEFTKGT